MTKFTTNKKNKIKWTKKKKRKKNEGILCLLGNSLDYITVQEPVSWRCVLGTMGVKKAKHEASGGGSWQGLHGGVMLSGLLMDT